MIGTLSIISADDVFVTSRYNKLQINIQPRTLPKSLEASWQQIFLYCLSRVDIFISSLFLLIYGASVLGITHTDRRTARVLHRWIRYIILVLLLPLLCISRHLSVLLLLLLKYQ